MKTHIPEHILEEIRHRADIIEVISDYLPLKASGKNFKGLCPFHNEKTPSFTANREKQIYHCFGCGAGGNVFRFLMEKEELPFIEAVRRLAARYQVSLPESGAPREDSWNEREVLYQLNARAAAYYHRLLKEHPGARNARDYLARRGIQPESIDRFQLGWAPDEWRHLLPHLQGSGKVTPDLLVHAGLMIKKEKEGGETVYYDRFRGRLMFPIHDGQGRVIGFGGRVLGEGEPKYLNTSETPVYKKGRHLYGHHLAKEGMRQQDRALIVEGYFDAIRCHQAGITPVVATCGTALTASQALSLKPFTRQIVLVFDADAAGHTAAERGFEVLVQQGLQVRVAALPRGEDPDSLIQKKGRDPFLQRVDRAPHFLAYLLDQALENGNPDRLEDKLEIVNRILPHLARLPNSVERTEWIRLVAERLKVDDRAFLDQLKKTLAQNRTRLEAAPPPQKPAPFNPERFLIQLMLSDEAVARDIQEQVPPEQFQDPALREIAGALFETLKAGETPEANRVLDRLDSPEAKSLLARMALAPIQFDNLSRAVQECTRALKKRAIAGKIEDLRRRRNAAQKAGDAEQSRLLHQQLKQLQEDLIPGSRFCIQT